MDRTDEWRVFVAVARLHSFAEAARILERSPQAVTRAVAALEARLGTRLLNRTTRSVSLTNDGERYLERARHALVELDRLETRSDAHAPLSGRITVTASVLFGQLHVIPLVTAFLELHPDLDLKLLLFDRVVSLAEEGVDLGVRLGPLPDSALKARLVGHVRTVVCASPAYLKRAGSPRRLDDLTRHSCIAFTGTSPMADRWSFPNANRRDRAIPVRARLTVNSAQAAIDAAVAGLGIVRVLSYQVARLVAERKLQIILVSFEGQAVPVHLVHLPGVQPRAVVSFLEFAAVQLSRRLAVARRGEVGYE